mmetsp:Transcript_87558/g.282970  ORF Transcript_87558/g.282970 Transcript_87558/m.282970 type:complete len:212 (-) Transcript_87558:108-743(-)
MGVRAGTRDSAGHSLHLGLRLHLRHGPCGAARWHRFRPGEGLRGLRADGVPDLGAGGERPGGLRRGHEGVQNRAGPPHLRVQGEGRGGEAHRGEAEVHGGLPQECSRRAGGHRAVLQGLAPGLHRRQLVVRGPQGRALRGNRGSEECPGLAPGRLQGEARGGPRGGEAHVPPEAPPGRRRAPHRLSEPHARASPARERARSGARRRPRTSG